MNLMKSRVLPRVFSLAIVVGFFGLFPESTCFARGAALPNYGKLLKKIESGDLSSVERYLSHPKININAAEVGNLPPLVAAAKAGKLEVVRLLLRMKFSPSLNLEVTSARGNTALTFAADCGHVEVVKALLSAGANVNAIGHNGQTPLISAVRARSHAIVTLLVSKGAVISFENYSGKSALSLARSEYARDPSEELRGIQAFLSYVQPYEEVRQDHAGGSNRIAAEESDARFQMRVLSEATLQKFKKKTPLQRALESAQVGDTECPICLVDYDHGDELVSHTRLTEPTGASDSSQCASVFHPYCFELALDRTSGQCPTCKDPVLVAVEGAKKDEPKILSRRQSFNQRVVPDAILVEESFGTPPIPPSTPLEFTLRDSEDPVALADTAPLLDHDVVLVILPNRRVSENKAIERNDAILRALSESTLTEQ